MAVNWREVPRESSIFAAREEFFKSEHESQEDKKEQEEEQRARQREGSILTESDAVPLANKLTRWRKFVTAGHDFVPINWSEDSDSEFKTSDTSRRSGQHENFSDTGKRAGNVASSPVLFSDSPLKGEGGEDYFRVVNYFSAAMVDGFNLEDFGNSGLDDTIEWATEEKDQSACGSEDSEHTESSEPSALRVSSVCNEDELHDNFKSSFCTFADKSPPATDKEEAETAEETIEDYWQDECTTSRDEEPARFQSRECRKRHFESGEDDKLPWAAKRRCLLCVVEDTLLVQQQTYGTGKEVNKNSLPLEDSHSEGEVSLGEGSSVSSVDSLESVLDSYSETDSDDSIEWATAPENESSGSETAQEYDLDGGVVADNEEESDMETSMSCSSASLSSDEMESNSVSSLSYFADESSSDEEISTFSFSRENSLAAGAKFNTLDSSKPANRKSFLSFFSLCGKVRAETQERPRRVRKRKNLFTGLICALIVKRFVDNYVLL